MPLTAAPPPVSLLDILVGHFVAVLSKMSAKLPTEYVACAPLPLLPLMQPLEHISHTTKQSGSGQGGSRVRCCLFYVLLPHHQLHILQLLTACGERGGSGKGGGTCWGH